MFLIYINFLTDFKLTIQNGIIIHNKYNMNNIIIIIISQIMQSNCEIIKTDSLIQMINTSNELDQLTNKWMFETERKPLEP